MELVNFYFPWNHEKICDFLMISGGIDISLLNIRSETWRQSTQVKLRILLHDQMLCCYFGKCISVHY